MKSDIEIAREANMQPIQTVAEKLSITADELDLYGKYKAKLTDELWERIKDRPDGKLVLVTAINPTPAGEGKTTTTVGLGQAMDKIGKKAIIALREPSLGPCFGLKGGAAGGGYAQVVPMDDLNLHFTGDFHAITSANNLLAAMLDNHIQQGNKLNIDPKQIVWKRCVDMNDRVLRNITVGLGRKVDGVTREDHFIITVASEIMAILCLADNMKDLKERLGRIIVAYTYEGKPVTAKEIEAVGAMAALLKDAIRPNMIQTLENTPALVHGGPFANIAHGCNSVRATKTALKLADYTITEAGFGADLGAEKFLDIKCRMADLKPDAVVLVATVRALKYNGGVKKEDLSEENLDALKAGIVNLEKHIENIAKFGVPCVVTLNQFVTDSEAELAYVKEFCEARGCEFALSKVWEKGGEGGIELAQKVIDTIENKITVSVHLSAILIIAQGYDPGIFPHPSHLITDHLPVSYYDHPTITALCFKRLSRHFFPIPVLEQRSKISLDSYCYRYKPTIEPVGSHLLLGYRQRYRARSFHNSRIRGSGQQYGLFQSIVFSHRIDTVGIIHPYRLQSGRYRMLSAGE